jgi:hypothetical protein
MMNDSASGSSVRKIRRKRSAVRLGPELLKLVEADQGGAPEFAAPFLEDRRRRADVRSVDEHGISVASEERFGGSRPFGVRNFD